MNILITNDDGIEAKGIKILSRKLQQFHNIIVVAPDSQRSASSHSITLTKPLLLKEVNLEGINAQCYSVSGTPVDCTKIAVTTISKEKIDIVISGINEGFNLGTDVLYSGTVSAAIEGAINNIPAIAISCDGSEEGYNIAAEYVEQVLEKIKYESMGNTVLNINIPAMAREEVKGIKVCSIGDRSYNNVYVEIGKEGVDSIYKITGDPQLPKEDNTDVAYIKEGYVTITPLHYDLTNFNLIKTIGSILDK